MKKHRDGISLLIQSIYSDSADFILISVKWMQLFREMFVASGERVINYIDITLTDDTFCAECFNESCYFSVFWEVFEGCVIYWLLSNVFLRTKEFPKYLNLFSMKIIVIESFACLFKVSRLKSACKLFKLFNSQTFPSFSSLSSLSNRPNRCFDREKGLRVDWLTYCF